MIRRYAPSTLRGVMMGHWMMLISISANISSKISTHLFNQFIMPTSLIPNSFYYDYFNYLGISSIIGGIMICIVMKYLFKFKEFYTVV
jgi:dipeptide/tripeptide permease